MTYSAEVLADSPLAYYRLGEASGTTMTDSSGNSRNGSYINGTPALGATGLLTGDADTAMEFTGAGSPSGSVSRAAWMDVNNLTVEAWIKPDAVAATYNIALRDSTSGSNRCWILRITATGRIDFAVWNTAGTLYQATTAASTIAASTRYHVVAVFNGSTAKVYVDDVEKASVAVTGTVRTSATQDIAIGGGSSRFDGILDEIAIYDAALSTTRVSAHYNAGIGAGNVVAVGQATETDTANAITRIVTVATGQATEADAANPVTFSGHNTIPVGQATEADSATTLSTILGVGTAAETDAANPILTDGSIAMQLAGTLPPWTAAIDIEHAREVALDATFPAWTAAVDLHIEGYITLDATLPPWTAAVDITTPRQIQLDATLPAWTAGFAFVKPPTTHVTRSGGRIRSGSAIVTTTPPVVPTPDAYVIHDYEIAQAFTVTAITNGRPELDVTTAQIARARPRIIVGGKDITYFRGIPTPSPAYRLVKPFLYGAGSLSLPQVSPVFERLSYGDLSWLTKGASIKVQRVDPETNAVIATDYEGFISSFNIDGNDLTCDLGGEVTGRAALTYRPVPVFRKNADAGYWLSRGFLRYTGRGLKGAAPITNGRLGPVLNVPVADMGGMDAIDYLNQLVALTTSPESGQAYEVTKVAGNWRVLPRDTETVDATIYLDDARMKPSLKRDIAEEPNRIYASGVSPTGERIMFRRYPGLTEANPAPYPFASNAPFGLGTTDADCDHPDQLPITALGGRLVGAGMMAPTSESSTFTADYVAAVRRVQREAGYAITGVMNVATWKACWDIDVTGYRLSADTWPAAQLSAVQRWNYNAAGAILNANPGYRSSVIPSDRQIDFGTGFTRPQITDWSRDQIISGDNWVGTVDCHLALIRGEHTPGNPIDAGDVMPVAEIRPGMNVWAPLFDGGTLFHVSGVSIPERRAGDSLKGTLTLDTRARPTMEAWEVIRRARESRKNPARIWLNQYRSSQQSKDMGTWDDVGGYVKRTRLRGGEWTVIPVVAGQEGTVRSLRMSTSPNREFVVAVFGKKISEGRLNHLVPNPLSAAGSARWEKESIRNKLDAKVMLYAAGTDAAPCGYFPKQKGDSHPLTGRWYDDAGFSYHTFGDPVLWLAIYVANDTWLDKGRIFTQQLESGA